MNSSCLYVGWVNHLRLYPRRHAFAYRISLVYLELGDIDASLKRIPGVSTRWWSPLRFRRRDHLGDPAESLDAAVRTLIRDRCGGDSRGPIHLLTGLGFLWHRFNPVSFYYCLDEGGKRLEYIVAEVNNTPWGEQHCYVLDARDQAPARVLRFSHDKDFHVSPFLPMAIRYHWRIGLPGERIGLGIRCSQGGAPVFAAGLALVRRPPGIRQVCRAFAAMPLMSLKTYAAIHWQALRLWLKSTPLFTHPGKAAKGEQQ